MQAPFSIDKETDNTLTNDKMNELSQFSFRLLEALAVDLGRFVSMAGAATSIIFVATKVLSRKTHDFRDKNVDLSRQT